MVLLLTMRRTLYTEVRANLLADDMDLPRSNEETRLRLLIVTGL